MKRWEERRLKKRANTAFLEALSKIADLERLRDGVHGYDYCIEVPPGMSAYEFSNRLADIHVDIYERFGVGVRALDVST